MPSSDSFGFRRRSKRRPKQGNVQTDPSLKEINYGSAVMPQKNIALAQNSAEPTIKTPKQSARKRRLKRTRSQQNDSMPEEKVSGDKENAEPPTTTEKQIEPVVPTEFKVLNQEEPKEDVAPGEFKVFDREESKEDQGKKINNNGEDETIEFYFENTDLQNVATQVSQLYNVTFIMDDIITPLASGNKALKGNKLSFKTHKPLNKKEGWNLFLTFLDIAGFAIVPDADPKIFRITTVQKAQRAAIPSFIGVTPESLPDSDQMIRYVYFIENINPETLKGIIDQMLSTSAGPSFALRELKALILTDKAYNIKTLMKIVKELDKVSMPQSMSVLKLSRADAEDVAKLYADITKTEDANVMSRLFPARRQPTSLYFPENVRVIPEKRSNSLILLGARDAIEKIENFVIKFIDVEPDKPYSPLHTYQLKYAEATNVATIMNDLTKFGAETAAGKVGGVRGGDKYFKPMLFIAEPSTNQLIIRGEYEDYLKAVEIINKLDEPQAQIAIEILILTVELAKNKQLGGQIRSKNNGVSCGPLGANVNFQTGNIGQGLAVNTDDGEKTYPGCQRLLGNLLDLVKNLASGNTVISLGCDAFGVWGIFRALETITNSEVISNPFLLTTNKTKASVSVGEIRRLTTGTIEGLNPVETQDDEEAALKVEITPQINSDGMIVLDIIVDITQFASGTNSQDAQRTKRKIDTKTTVADNEVIALGGLIRNKIEDNTAKTPMFGDIPLLGWLFKNRSKSESKANLLILVSTKIIKPGSEEGLAQFTNKHVDDYYGALGQMYDVGQKKDPLTRLFFEESKKDVARRVEDLLFKGTKQKKARKKRWQRKRRSKVENKQPLVTGKKPEIVQSKELIQPQKPIEGYKQVLAKGKNRQRVSLVDLCSDDGERTS